MARKHRAGGAGGSRPVEATRAGTRQPTGPTTSKVPAREAEAATEGQGRAVPSLRHLDAVTLARGGDPASTGQRIPESEIKGAVEVKDSGELARLHLDIELPWHLALAILRLVRGVPDRGDEPK